MLLAYIFRSITHRVHFLDKASRDLFIRAKDLFIAAVDGKGPDHTGIRAGRGKLSVEFGPIRSARQRTERFLSGGRRRPKTCQIAPKSCSSLPSVITNW